MPLPEWLEFDGTAGTFSGTPQAASSAERLIVQVTATDTVGNAVSHRFALTIEGFNNAPVLGEAASSDMNVAESGAGATGDLHAGGSFTYADEDAEDVGFGNGGAIEGVAGDGLSGDWQAGSDSDSEGRGVELAGIYGSLYLKADGSWTYLLDDGDPDTEALAAGQTATDSFSFRIDDGAEWNADRYSNMLTIHVEIAGAEESPTNRPPTAAPVHGEGKEHKSYFIEKASLGFADPDKGDTLQAVIIVSLPTSDKGRLVLDGNPVQAGDKILQSDLPSLQLKPVNRMNDYTASFTYKVSDGNNDSGEAVMNITVRSENERPVVDAALLNDTTTAEGERFDYSIPEGTFSDPDTDDRLTYTAQIASDSAVVQRDANPVTTAASKMPDGEGAMPLPEWLEFDGTAGTFSGTPQAASSAERLIVQVTATDTVGNAVSHRFALTIEGFNNAPVLGEAASSDMNVAESGAEATGDLHASGSFTYADEDAEDVGFGNGGAIEGVAGDGLSGNWQAGSDSDSEGRGVELAGTYGSLYLKADGSWTYLLDDGDPDTEALAAGQTARDSFSFRIDDGAEWNADRYSNKLTIHVKITGADPINLVPTFQVADITATADTVNVVLRRTGNNMDAVAVRVNVTSPNGYVEAGERNVMFADGDTEKTLSLPIQRTFGPGDRVTVTLVQDAAYLVSSDMNSGEIEIAGNDRETRDRNVKEALGGFARAMGWDAVDTGERQGRVSRQE